MLMVGKRAGDRAADTFESRDSSRIRWLANWAFATFHPTYRRAFVLSPQHRTLYVLRQSEDVTCDKMGENMLKLRTQPTHRPAS